MVAAALPAQRGELRPQTAQHTGCSANWSRLDEEFKTADAGKQRSLLLVRRLLHLPISPDLAFSCGEDLDWGKVLKLLPFQQCLYYTIVVLCPVACVGQVMCAVDATASTTFFLKGQGLCFCSKQMFTSRHCWGYIPAKKEKFSNQKT